MQDEYRNCQIIDKYFNNIQISWKNNICINFEYLDRLKFRIVNKLDCLNSKWDYQDYLNWFKYDWINQYEYYKNTECDKYFLSFANPYVKWFFDNEKFYKVQNISPDLITILFNYIKIDDVKYYILFNDYINLDFIKLKKLKYYGYVKKVNKKYKIIYEIGEIKL